MEKKIMKNKFYHFFSIIMAFSLSLSAQPDEYKPDPQSVLQLIRKEKIKHVLPLAMRNNNVDMWIHVTRAGDPDPLEYEFGSTSGYLIFTDVGDRIEKAVFAGYFGGEGGIEDIDVTTPAFDVTPAELIHGIITEKGVVTYPYKESLEKQRNAS